MFKHLMHYNNLLALLSGVEMLHELCHVLASKPVEQIILHQLFLFFNV